MALIAVITWKTQPRWLQTLFFLGLGETLVATSYLLGCNELDAVIAYALWTLVRAMSMAGKIADVKYSIVSLIHIPRNCHKSEYIIEASHFRGWPEHNYDTYSLSSSNFTNGWLTSSNV